MTLLAKLRAQSGGVDCDNAVTWCDAVPHGRRPEIALESQDNGVCQGRRRVLEEALGVVADVVVSWDEELIVGRGKYAAEAMDLARESAEKWLELLQGVVEGRGARDDDAHDVIYKLMRTDRAEGQW